MTSDQSCAGVGELLPAFSKLAYYSDVETSDTEDDHHFVPPPVTPELLAMLLKQVFRDQTCCPRPPFSDLFSQLQVEFYFSDANLPTDKKLLKLIRKDPLGFGKGADVPPACSMSICMASRECPVLDPCPRAHAWIPLARQSLSRSLETSGRSAP